MAIKTIKIFPPIGIARVGNSTDPDGFFIGPERPGEDPRPPGGYKDANCRVKRQAARFRLFAYDEADQLIVENGKPKEITAATAGITWRIEVANTKASANRVQGIEKTDEPKRRNLGILATELEIRPTPVSGTVPFELAGPNQSVTFDNGKFMGTVVPLGEARTDEDARLIVLGGFGVARYGGPGDPPQSLGAGYNHDGWCDDVSDGPVTADVTINSVLFKALPAWVIVGPPAFAPSVPPLKTLYDVLLQAAIDRQLTIPAALVPATPSFVRDIYPILRGAEASGRLTAAAEGHHAGFAPKNFPVPEGMRQAAINRLRKFDQPYDPDPMKPQMPLQWADDYLTGGKLVPTKTQYEIVEKWAKGDFIDDWPGALPDADADITPEGLTRAALEHCIGGGLRPGVEVSWQMREAVKSYDTPFATPHYVEYSEVFRPKHDQPVPDGTDITILLRAGDITKHLAVPWQADYYECQKQGVVAWWPSHHPDDVFPESGGEQTPWTRDLVYDKVSMIEEWSKLGFVVPNEAGELIETERTVACRKIALIVHKHSFSAAEVGAMASVPKVFPWALSVRAEGFTPSDLGIATEQPVVPTVAPAVTFVRADGTVISGNVMRATPKTATSQFVPFNAGQKQLITFDYDVEFQDASLFSANGAAIESQDLTVLASKTWNDGENQGVVTADHLVTLVNQLAPKMVDGAVPWLSTDLRVFTVLEGKPFAPLGLTMGSDKSAALAFIDNVVSSFNALPQDNHPFDGLSDDQQTSALAVSEKLSDTQNIERRAFNFAIARVRYQGQTLPAKDIRVFFRLFKTLTPSVEYSEQTTYRRGEADESPIPLLGIDLAGYVVSMPFFGRARVDSATTSLDKQNDDLNTRTLGPAGADGVHGYFGCWLDFNQIEPQFPRQPTTPDGPWPLNTGQADVNAKRISIMEHLGGDHACLVAEVSFAEKAIEDGASPAGHDFLAQRNLAWVSPDNPGGIETRTVQHSFMIMPSADPSPALPQELMIRWSGLPPASSMTLYMPDVEALEVVRMAAGRMDASGLTMVDAHTLQIAPGGVSYVPIPGPRTRHIAALLTMVLPLGIQRGQMFAVLVHQLTGSPRRATGAFQINLPISISSALVEPEIRRLSVMRHIAQSIPTDDPWRDIFDRYLGQVAARVRGFGGDPDAVAPAADGSAVDRVKQRCERLCWLFAGALGLAVAIAGALRSRPPLATLVLLAAFTLGWFWWRRCKPGPCTFWRAIGIGFVLGSALLGLLVLLGFGGATLVAWLAAAALAGGIILLVTALACDRCASCG